MAPRRGLPRIPGTAASLLQEALGASWELVPGLRGEGDSAPASWLSQDHPGPLEEGPGEGSFKTPRRVQRVQAEQGGGSLPPKRLSCSGWPQPPCKLSGRREAGLASRTALGRLRAAGHRTEGPSSSGDTAPH